MALEVDAEFNVHRRKSGMYVLIIIFLIQKYPECFWGILIGMLIDNITKIIDH